MSMKLMEQSEEEWVLTAQPKPGEQEQQKGAHGTQGIPTLERTKKWTNDSGICRRCHDVEEDVTYIFLKCSKARSKWRRAAEQFGDTVFILQEGCSLIDLVDTLWKQGNLARIAIGVETMWIIWLERNAKTYSDLEIPIPLLVSAKMARELIQAKLETLNERAVEYQALRSAAEMILEKFPELASAREEEDLSTTNP
ncbi:hypothetical protein R1sor_012438 [Riccia sorocarpa]|uniref:Reverse transcriptase zinc-binding domain-containing protein n=1 Tax=Riccia sorocarpa TaxID=122646 RepID=A0ABD3I6G8_9MARC